MKRHLSFIKNVLRSNLPDPKPYKLNFALTYRCNHRCLNCNIWKMKPENELTAKEIDTIFSKYQFNWINLTGGEISLHPEIDAVIEAVIKRNPNLYILTMTTNGLLTDKIVNIAKKIAESDIPFTMVTVSLDGVEKIHNKVRGLPVAYQQAIKTIKTLKKIPKLKVQYGYSIYPENAGKIKEFIKHMQSIFPDFSVNQMHINTYNTSSHYYGDNAEKESKLQDNYTELATNDLKYFLSLYKRNLSYEHVGERVFQKLAIEHLHTGKMPLPCKSLQTSLFLDSFGKIYPCIIWNKEVANVRDVQYDINNITKLPIYKQLIDIIRQKKCPNCWTVCEGTQTMLGNLLHPKYLKNVI